MQLPEVAEEEEAYELWEVYDVAEEQELNGEVVEEGEEELVYFEL